MRTPTFLMVITASVLLGCSGDGTSPIDRSEREPGTPVVIAPGEIVATVLQAEVPMTDSVSVELRNTGTRNWSVNAGCRRLQAQGDDGEWTSPYAEPLWLCAPDAGALGAGATVVVRVALAPEARPGTHRLQLGLVLAVERSEAADVFSNAFVVR